MPHLPDTPWAWPLSAVLKAPSFHLQKTTLTQQAHSDSPTLELIFWIWGCQHRLRLCQQKCALCVCLDGNEAQVKSREEQSCPGMHGVGMAQWD